MDRSLSIDDFLSVADALDAEASSLAQSLPGQRDRSRRRVARALVKRCFGLSEALRGADADTPEGRAVLHEANAVHRQLATALGRNLFAHLDDITVGAGAPKAHPQMAAVMRIQWPVRTDLHRFERLSDRFESVIARSRARDDWVDALEARANARVSEGEESQREPIVDMDTTELARSRSS